MFPLDRPKDRSPKDFYQIEVLRVALAMSNDLSSAFAFHACREAMQVNEQIVDQIKFNNTSQRVVSASLYQSTILAVCRIWDDPNTASMNQVRRRLARGLIQKELSEIFEGGFDKEAFDAWAADVDRMAKSDVLQSMQRLRNERLAHTTSPNELSQSRAGPLNEGDENLFLEETAKLLKRLQALIGHGPVDYLGEHARMLKESEDFWEEFEKREPGASPSNR
jgi:hypothetical protein